MTEIAAPLTVVAAIAPAQSTEIARPPGTPEWVDMEAAAAAQEQKDAKQAAESAADRAASVPAKPYGYTEPKLPEGMGPPPAQINQLREVAHAEQLTKGEYQQFTMAIALAAREAQIGGSVEAYTRKNVDRLRALWGDNYSLEITGATRQLHRLQSAYPIAQQIFQGHVLSNEFVVRQLAAMDKRRGGK